MPPDGKPGAAKVRVFDPKTSQQIASGEELPDAEAPSASLARAFCCTDGNGALLVYYFGKCGREVQVQIGHNEGVLAHLGTRWNGGHREWTLEW